MPTYQYRCKECDHDFEVVQSFSDDPLESCPVCEGRLKKVYGNVGISFKGSGFYKTDSRGTKTSESTTPSKTESPTSGDSPKKDPPAGDKKASTSGSTSSSGSSGSDTKGSDTKGS